jgi:hypothetical protein
VDDDEDLRDDFKDSVSKICGNGATSMDTDGGASAPAGSGGGVCKLPLSLASPMPWKKV